MKRLFIFILSIYSTILLADHRSFALELEDSLTHGNATFLKSRLDYESIFKKILSTDEEYIKHNEAFKTYILNSYHLGDVITAQIKAGADYKFHKMIQNEALFRLVPPRGGLNYHSYQIHQKNGQFLIKDIYLYLSGNYLSESIEQSYHAFLYSKEPKFRSDSNKVQKVLDGERISRAQIYYQVKKYQQAQAAIDSVEGELMESKSYLIFKQMIYAKMDLLSFEAMAAVFENFYPNDPSMHLTLIDGFIQIGKFDEALKRVNQLDSILLIDHYLNFHRANIYFLKGHAKKAIEYSLAFHYHFPENLFGYYVALNAYVLDNNLDGCILILNQLKQQFQLSKFEIHQTLGEYQYLLQSDQYNLWLNNSP